MIIGGDYTHHFQIGPQSPGQVMQKAIESGSQANDSFTAQASGNAVAAGGPGSPSGSCGGGGGRGAGW